MIDLFRTPPPGLKMQKHLRFRNCDIFCLFIISLAVLEKVPRRRTKEKESPFPHKLYIWPRIELRPTISSTQPSYRLRHLLQLSLPHVSSSTVVCETIVMIPCSDKRLLTTRRRHAVHTVHHFEWFSNVFTIPG
jgi:hypothetical protein